MMVVIGIPTTSGSRTGFWTSVSYHARYAVGKVLPRYQPVPSYERVMELAWQLIATPITYSNVIKRARTFEKVEMALQKAQEEEKANAEERDQLEIKYDPTAIK